MRIAILTSGRFHVCDLARELDALGHDVLFYSLLSKWQTRRFGLPDRCNRWLGGYLAPVYGLARAASRGRFEDQGRKVLVRALDSVASRLVERCDLFIGMSGMCLNTIKAVRQKYQATVFLERGSRHILSQREILESLPGVTNGLRQWMVDRELAEYELADRIVIPSMHVERSFVQHGVSDAKLFRNPYGVDLTMFPPTLAPASDLPRQIVMAGTWSLRKGCDVLVEAWRGLKGVRLLHVGAVGDAELPSDAGFDHHAPVSQRDLTKWYAQSHVFALASREEGLALVQAQALASGLPVVCTDRTGGEDLSRLLGNNEIVTVVPNGDPIALREALVRVLEKSRLVTGVRDLLGASRQELSWQSYGARYNQVLAG